MCYSTSLLPWALFRILGGDEIQSSIIALQNMTQNETLTKTNSFFPISCKKVSILQYVPVVLMTSAYCYFYVLILDYPTNSLFLLWWNRISG